MESLENQIALSTCCCSHNFKDGYAMLEWIEKIGFKKVELSHGIPINLAPGILKAVQDGVISVVSVHNFCPLPIGINSPMPNLFKPTSRNKAEVILWKRYTEETIKFAKSVLAEKVVMHSGSAWFFFGSPVPRLYKWINDSSIQFQELARDSDYIAIRDKVIGKIKRSSTKRYDSLESNFKYISDFAKTHSIILGIENREGLSELPLDQDHVEFVKKFSLKDPIRYWHDTGHAEIKSLYGLLDHEDRLSKLKDYTTGFHIHDVSDSGEDHQEVGTGIIDFEMLSRYMDPSKHSLILELSPTLSLDAILRSRDYVRKLI